MEERGEREGWKKCKRGREKKTLTETELKIIDMTKYDITQSP